MRTIAEMISLEGRVAAITGGGGHIGQALAESLAEQGCGIILLDRSENVLVAAADKLRKRWQVQVETLQIDLENEAERKTVKKSIADAFGRLDVLINAAGFVGDSELRGWVVPFEQQSMETWRRAMEVNITAAFHLSQELASMLRLSGHGSIINIASIYGVVGPDMRLYDGTHLGNPAAYAASKGAMIQMTKWLATVLAPEIRVNCISPGGVARGQPESFTDQYVARTPLRRMGREEDFKGAAVYFASDLSSWVSGENLMVDGGWTAW